MNMFLIAIVLPPSAYLLGSIPFGLLIVRLLTKVDIRHIGSGNIGATNVKRAVGTKWAAATLICDGLKGFLPVLTALWLYQTTYQWLPAITTLAAIAGHMYPLYFGFKPGGKGVATTLGCLLIIAPMACAVAIVIFIPAVYLSKRVSVGSLAATLSMPPATWFTTHDPAIAMAAIIIMSLILSRHKDNIQRIAQGLEPTI
jgi:acyl phosphate:glycerol-3-phosphate acyltransferase